jgi:hypothetical protein
VEEAVVCAGNEVLLKVSNKSSGTVGVLQDILGHLLKPHLIPFSNVILTIKIVTCQINIFIKCSVAKKETYCAAVASYKRSSFMKSVCYDFA